MKLPGDRVMTELLSRFSRAGAKSLILEKNGQVINTMPKRQITTFFMDPLSLQKHVDKKVYDLFQPYKTSIQDDMRLGGYFERILVQRIAPYFEQTGAVHMMIVPSKYEITKVI